mgnify:CR=1 FL=1|jgi:hypothetical protein
MHAPPTSHIVNFLPFTSTVYTLNPFVGTTAISYCNFSLYSIVVFPDASNPTINILYYFDCFELKFPIIFVYILFYQCMKFIIKSDSDKLMLYRYIKY